MAEYENLTGDLDAKPELLRRLNDFAKKVGRTFVVVSGYRSVAEQQYLWDNSARLGLVRGKTVAAPGRSNHQTGSAADVTVGGVAIQGVFSRARILAAGLVPLAGDAPHVELPGARGQSGGDVSTAGGRARGTTTARPRTTTGGNTPADWLRQGGWPSNLIPTMVAIGGAESGWRVDAESKPNTNGTIDRGWLQINSVHGYDPHKLVTDPVYTARAGYDIYKRQGFGAWSVYNSGAYKAFLGKTPTPQPGRVRPGGDADTSDGSTGSGSASGDSGGADMELVAFWDHLPGIPNPLDLFKGAGKAIKGGTDFLKWIAWIFHPLNILRMIEFWAGFNFLIMGFVALIAAWRGASAEDAVALIPQARAAKAARATQAAKTAKTTGKVTDGAQAAQRAPQKRPDGRADLKVA